MSAGLQAAAPEAVNAQNRAIFTLAGIGPLGGGFPEGGFGGDGGLAGMARLDTPTGVVEEPGGGFVIADPGNGRIRVVEADGSIRTLVHGVLRAPVGITRRANGDLLIADVTAHRVWVVSPAGLITPFAGTGTAGFSGEGGPAQQADLQNPTAVVETTDGSVLIADTGNQRVRRVDVSGAIRTVAGNGRFGFAGDRGPALRAELAAPTGLALRRNNILIADSENHRIREVDPNGVIRTVAGWRREGFAGDGGAAIRARLDRPLAVSSTGDGGFLIADSLNNRIRRVSASGRIRTVAGSSRIGGYAGDGRSPTRARLRTPSGVLETASRELVIADADNNVMRYIPPRLPPRLVVAASGRAHRSHGRWALRIRIVSTRPCYAEITVLDRRRRALIRVTRRAGPAARRLTIRGLRRQANSLRIAVRGRGSVRAGSVAAVLAAD